MRRAVGRLDTLVNNAGFLRDRMLVNLDEDDWDTVLRVHLTGHFLPLKHAAAHWRAEARAGRPPAARTRMTERTFAETMAAPASGFDAMAPENVSPLVVWLGSAASTGVTGRVFAAEAGRITVMEGWRPGPTTDKGARWSPGEAGEAVRKLLTEAEAPGAVYGA